MRNNQKPILIALIIAAVISVIILTQTNGSWLNKNTPPTNPDMIAPINESTMKTPAPAQAPVAVPVPAPASDNATPLDDTQASDNSMPTCPAVAETMPDGTPVPGGMMLQNGTQVPCTMAGHIQNSMNNTDTGTNPNMDNMNGDNMNANTTTNPNMDTTNGNTATTNPDMNNMNNMNNTDSNAATNSTMQQEEMNSVNGAAGSATSANPENTDQESK